MKLFCFLLFLLLCAATLYATDIGIRSETERRDSSVTLITNHQKGLFDFVGNNERKLFVEKTENEIFNTVSPAKKNELGVLIIPAALISYGALTHAVKPLRQFDTYVDDEVNKHFKRRSLEEYLLGASVVAVYGLDLVGVKAKHNFRDRTFVTIASHLFMSGSVRVVKIASGVKRPDGNNRHSFPSGHTATAFTGAHILFKEYREVSPWIGISGYAVATTVGAMRILNRKHWVSDVVAGAGFGILSAEIGYMLLPVFHRIIDVEKNKTSFVVAPIVGNNQYGLGFAYVF